MNIYVIGQLVGLHYNTETKKMHYMMDIVMNAITECGEHVLRLTDHDVNMIMLAKKKAGYELVEGRFVA